MHGPRRAARLQQVLETTATILARHRLATGLIVCMLALLVLGLDFTSPPYIEYSVIYAILIAFATEFAAWQLGIVLAVLLPIGHLVAYFLSGQQSYPLSVEAVNLALLFFVGIGTVYLLRTLKHMEELRQENLRLETLQQTMITVNDIVLNRLQVMQFMMHLAEQGKPLTRDQVRLGKSALEDMAGRLHDLSHLNHYETTEVTAGVRAVQMPKPTETSQPVAGPPQPAHPGIVGSRLAP
jgi:hypothetical protein